MELHFETLTPEARAAVEKLVQESGKPLAVILSELLVRGAEQSTRAENGAPRSRDEEEDAWEEILASGRMLRLAEPDGEGRKLLESLSYAYLGDWINRQRHGIKENEEGAEGRLAAAVELQGELGKEKSHV